ncbi:MAG: caspase family protein, partial [Flavobacteriaceae bacterium]|nr:caspase family protein [Flavobacteriaceae bacterium]
SIERPEVTLLNKNQLSPVAKAEEIQVDLSFSSSAKTFTVYDNGVPVVSGKVPNSGKTSEKIKLLQGNNNISVIALDSKGFESDPETFSVINQEVSQKPVVHYVGIGVSKYVNSSMDLRYADKDVRSIAEYLGTKFENRITIDTLTNGQVTKENIANLKLKLMNTNINDIVIVSFSGHGLVDDDFNFYFATHDINFDNPEARGLSYEAMQDLLSGIPARRKLLLLDACHSGEIDTDEELEQVA